MPTRKSNSLKRCITLTQLVFYGLGTILGAGIYVLIGKIAGLTGYLSPWAFLLAAVLAAFSALAYAELSAQYPKSAGESVYIENSFHIPLLTLLTGLFIIFSGIVSCATLAHGFAGYLTTLVDAPKLMIAISLIFILGILTSWGIKESIVVAVLITVIEIIGLVIVIASSAQHWTDLNLILPKVMQWKPEMTLPILSAAFLAFYAFIGFEDIVNVAEETIDPKKNLPKAILICLIISTIFYVLVAFAALVSVDPKSLGESDAPLALVYQKNTGLKPTLISLISLFATINGALVQIIMSSRVLYGLAERFSQIQVFRNVSPKTKTPIRSIAVVTAFAIFAVTALPLVELAQATSLFMVLVFILINAALAKLKYEKKILGGIPIWVPVLGVILNAAFLISQFL